MNVRVIVLRWPPVAAETVWYAVAVAVGLALARLPPRSRAQSWLGGALVLAASAWYFAWLFGG